MARQPGELWPFFYKGRKSNSSHHRAHCLACVKSKAPAHIQAQQSIEGIAALDGESWFEEALEAAGSVNGEKSSMIAHILGGVAPCRLASEAARKTANELRAELQRAAGKRVRVEANGGDEVDDDRDGAVAAPSKKRKAIDRVQKQQTTLDGKVFKGINIPFSEQEAKDIRTQFLRATISANLPYTWVENPEMITLFLMMRGQAGKVMLSAKQLSTSLLKDENERVEKEVRDEVKGEDVSLTCDGVKDISKNSLTGVNISFNFKPYLVDLYNSTPDKKDGQSMYEAFTKMIDIAEKTYQCSVVAMGTDNDGGSRAGRVLLGKERPYLFTFPCIVHQGQLTLHDYFKANPKAEATSEEATELVGWLNNHGRVRTIFNEVQLGHNGKVLTYLVANATRWTTHVISFHRLEEVKPALRMAALSRREEIIAAQVGAEKNTREAQKLRRAAEKQLDLIDSAAFWQRLSGVTEDLEPVCYATNICQSDRARPDIVLLAFVGMFLYFKKHPNRQVSSEMARWLERRWQGFDQEMMVAALILNPFERLDPFGPDANANPFAVQALIATFFRKYIDRPIPNELDPDEVDNLVAKRLERIQAVSIATMNYLAFSGPFAPWPEHRAAFEQIHGKDPLVFWNQLWTDSRTAELAKFAVTLLSTVLNTAGNERTFSDVKIKKTRLRNRLGTEKLHQMIKVGANLREHQYTRQLRDPRKPRENHNEERLSKLLEVPRYAEALDGPDEDLVDSGSHWRREFVKWGERARMEDTEGDEDNGEGLFTTTTTASKWLPRSLALLFGGKPAGDEEADLGAVLSLRRTRCTGWSEEALRMELLAQEEEDGILDDGALEGSGDEYDG
ncbi:hypothetical protein V5O48_015656 [Marasmius crinis-equi]|uniref:DUF659 domain-containing protein n=1 Tax=Marasmius crinis-equi TaxID=585013 RepID=A0ABR3ETX6_9AGAR